MGKGENMYKELINQIEKHRKIIIYRHQRPDGDALGSQIGLKEALVLNYPDKEIYAVGSSSERFDFIGVMDEISEEVYENALIIIVDTPEENMIDGQYYEKGNFIVKIDHHIPRKTYANLDIVDTSFESCASLVAHILLISELKLNVEAAKALFTGIVTDSGRFRFDSVSPRTFYIAGELLEHGFNLGDIYNNLYIEDIDIVKLRSKYVLKFKLTKKNVAYIITTKEELAEYGVDFSTASRGMVNTMAGIKGIDIWANFTEDEENNCIIAELRSSKYDINKVAVKYGGGGHKLASGASLKDFTVVEAMLADLESLIEE